MSAECRLKLQLQITERELKTRLQHQTVPFEFKDAVELSLRQVNSLISLVDQLLDVSRIRLDKMLLNYSQFDFSQAIRMIVEQMMPTLMAAHCEAGVAE